jgi:Na+-translocating ferredoxin:NAD+ oxidoreductase RnfC subunit
MLSASCGNFKDINSYLNTFYCSSCGVCEMYACPQGLSPRKLIQTVKMALRASGVTPPSDVKASSVSPIREYRKIPLDRLVSRLGVKKYQTNAPLNNELIDGFSTVNILTSQHIGVPAKPVVKFGDFVEKGQVIAEAVDGLSVNIHASISGLVIGVDDNCITIKKKD